MITKDKILNQIAKTFVYKKPEVLKLLQAYGFEIENPTNKQMLVYLLTMFEESDEFNQEFAFLMLVDNPKTEDESDAAAVLAVSAAIESLGNMVGNIYQSKAVKEQTEGETERKLLDLIMNQETLKAKAAEPKSSNWQWIFLGFLILVMLGFLGFLIYQKNKSNAKMRK